MKSRDEPEVLDFRDAAAWRRWLERNHGRSNGEWVYLYKKDASRTGLSYPAALDEALCFGWIDGMVRAVDDDRYRQRWTPRRKGSIWSAVNRDKVKRLMAEGRMAEPGLAAVKAAKKTGAWQAAYSSRRARPEAPADLLAALREIPEADANFLAWAPSHRTAYVAWVLDAKKPETRQRRIAAVVRCAQENRKPGMDSPYR